MASLPESVGASRLLTLVFTDLVGSTALKAQKGDEAAGVLIERCRETLERLSRESVGRVIDWAGDGCFQTFETPSAAVRFALRLQQAHANEPELPQVRTGIHMGEVSERVTASEIRVDGLAVDLASRVQSLALPGQILMSSAVFNSARQRINSGEFATPIAWHAHGAYLFTGFDDAIEVGEAGLEGIAPLKSPAGSEKAQRAVAPTDEAALGWRPAAGLGIPGHTHWVLDKQLGVGGYGEVWLASNVKSHNKHVFKFCFQPDRIKGLKREVVLFRLLKETLGDRGDIARVLDWDLETPPFFIESEYTEGGDLKDWAEQKGGLSSIALETRLEIVAQAATALEAAHTSGVLHKDIKPANILIHEAAGVPKACLTDFGIGLLTDPNALKDRGITATGLTKTLIPSHTSSTSGTAMYLAPELHEGKPPSVKSDIYSLGVLLYQTVIGDFSRAVAQGWERDVGDPVLREDIAMCVEGEPAARLGSAGELADRLRSIRRRRDEYAANLQSAERARRASERRRKSLRALAIGVPVALLIAVGIAFATVQRRSSDRQAREAEVRETDLTELRRLVADEKYADAYRLAQQIESVIPNDPILREQFEAATVAMSIETDPPGAAVRYKPYEEPAADWTELGNTPLNDIRIPRGHLRWNLRLDGYDERTFVYRAEHATDMDAGAFPDRNRPKFSLIREGELPSDSVPVDGGAFIMGLTGLPASPSEVASFFIDRTEVTNEKYKEFVEAGGYTSPEHWEHEFRDGDVVLSFEEAMSRFVDPNGRQGPSTWELGTYPAGHDAFPVQGVSWFEAAAYSKFRGKQLPTVYHWNRAALPRFEILECFARLVAPLSNIGETTGPMRVASSEGMAYSGANDMAGNVREWCYNAIDDRRYVLGGAWSDVVYMFTQLAYQSPWSRDATNGFRCMTIPEDAPVPDALASALSLKSEDYENTPPVSDEAFGIYKRMYGYDRTPLNPRLEGEVADARGWNRQTVTIDAVYGAERIILHLYIPNSASPPYPAVVFFPGVDSVQFRQLNTAYENAFDFVVRSGRAIVYSEYSGMYSRNDGNSFLRLFPATIAQLFREWSQDLGRTVDYLETRDDIDTDPLAYWGASFGASIGPIMIGTADRFDAAIFTSGGLSPFESISRKPEVDVVTFLPRITLPLLILNGEYDYIYPVDSGQGPFVRMLGTPDELKRYVTFDAGHFPFPRTPMINEVLTFLDRFQPLTESGIDQSDP